MGKRSRSQISGDIGEVAVQKLFADNGWIVSPILKDYGEDFLVIPVFDGSVGEYFIFAQVKKISGEQKTIKISPANVGRWLNSHALVYLFVVDKNDKILFTCAEESQKLRELYIESVETGHDDSTNISIRGFRRLDSFDTLVRHSVMMHAIRSCERLEGNRQISRTFAKENGRGTNDAKLDDVFELKSMFLSRHLLQAWGYMSGENFVDKKIFDDCALIVVALCLEKKQLRAPIIIERDLVIRRFILWHFCHNHEAVPRSEVELSLVNLLLFTFETILDEKIAVIAAQIGKKLVMRLPIGHPDWVSQAQALIKNSGMPYILKKRRLAGIARLPLRPLRACADNSWILCMTSRNFFSGDTSYNASGGVRRSRGQIQATRAIIQRVIVAHVAVTHLSRASWTF